jgi:hypothetical protein
MMKVESWRRERKRKLRWENGQVEVICPYSLIS